MKTQKLTEQEYQDKIKAIDAELKALTENGEVPKPFDAKETNNTTPMSWFGREMTDVAMKGFDIPATLTPLQETFTQNPVGGIVATKPGIDPENNLEPLKLRVGHNNTGFFVEQETGDVMHSLNQIGGGVIDLVTEGEIKFDERVEMSLPYKTYNKDINDIVSGMEVILLNDKGKATKPFNWKNYALNVNDRQVRKIRIKGNNSKITSVMANLDENMVAERGDDYLDIYVPVESARYVSPAENVERVSQQLEAVPLIGSIARQVNDMSVNTERAIRSIAEKKPIGEVAMNLGLWGMGAAFTIIPVAQKITMVGDTIVGSGVKPASKLLGFGEKTTETLSELAHYGVAARYKFLSGAIASSAASSITQKNMNWEKNPDESDKDYEARMGLQSSIVEMAGQIAFFLPHAIGRATSGSPFDRKTSMIRRWEMPEKKIQVGEKTIDVVFDSKVRRDATTKIEKEANELYSKRVKEEADRINLDRLEGEMMLEHQARNEKARIKFIEEKMKEYDPQITKEDASLMKGEKPYALLGIVPINEKGGVNTVMYEVKPGQTITEAVTAFAVENPMLRKIFVSEPLGITKKSIMAFTNKLGEAYTNSLPLLFDNIIRHPMKYYGATKEFWDRRNVEIDKADAKKIAPIQKQVFDKYEPLFVELNSRGLPDERHKIERHKLLIQERQELIDTLRSQGVEDSAIKKVENDIGFINSKKAVAEYEKRSDTVTEKSKTETFNPDEMLSNKRVEEPVVETKDTGRKTKPKEFSETTVYYELDGRDIFKSEVMNLAKKTAKEMGITNRQALELLQKETNIISDPVKVEVFDENNTIAEWRSKKYNDLKKIIKETAKEAGQKYDDNAVKKFVKEHKDNTVAQIREIFGLKPKEVAEVKPEPIDVQAEPKPYSERLDTRPVAENAPKTIVDFRAGKKSVRQTQLPEKENKTDAKVKKTEQVKEEPIEIIETEPEPQSITKKNKVVKDKVTGIEKEPVINEVVAETKPVKAKKGKEIKAVEEPKAEIKEEKVEPTPEPIKESKPIIAPEKTISDILQKTGAQNRKKTDPFYKNADVILSAKDSEVDSVIDSVVKNMGQLHQKKDGTLNTLAEIATRLRTEASNSTDAKATETLNKAVERIEKYAQRIISEVERVPTQDEATAALKRGATNGKITLRGRTVEATKGYKEIVDSPLTDVKTKETAMKRYIASGKGDPEVRAEYEAVLKAVYDAQRIEDHKRQNEIAKTQEEVIEKREIDLNKINKEIIKADDPQKAFNDNFEFIRDNAGAVARNMVEALTRRFPDLAKNNKSVESFLFGETKTRFDAYKDDPVKLAEKMRGELDALLPYEYGEYNLSSSIATLRAAIGRKEHPAVIENIIQGIEDAVVRSIRNNSNYRATGDKSGVTGYESAKEYIINEAIKSTKKKGIKKLADIISKDDHGALAEVLLRIANSKETVEMRYAVIADVIKKYGQRISERVSEGAEHIVDAVFKNATKELGNEHLAEMFRIDLMKKSVEIPENKREGKKKKPIDTQKVVTDATDLNTTMSNISSLLGKANAIYRKLTGDDLVDVSAFKKKTKKGNEYRLDILESIINKLINETPFIADSNNRKALEAYENALMEAVRLKDSRKVIEKPGKSGAEFYLASGLPVQGMWNATKWLVSEIARLGRWAKNKTISATERLRASESAKYLRSLFVDFFIGRNKALRELATQMREMQFESRKTYLTAIEEAGVERPYTFGMDAKTMARTFLFNIQHPLRKMAKEIGADIEPLDAIITTRFDKAAEGYRTQTDWVRNMVNGEQSLMVRLKKAGLTQADLEKFLLVRHVGERIDYFVNNLLRDSVPQKRIDENSNRIIELLDERMFLRDLQVTTGKNHSKKIATIEKEISKLEKENLFHELDRDIVRKSLEEKYDKGHEAIGLSKHEAKTAYDQLMNKNPEIEKFANEFKEKVIDQILETYYRGGLITEEKYNELKSRYKYYIPAKIEDFGISDSANLLADSYDRTFSRSKVGKSRTNPDLIKAEGTAGYLPESPMANSLSMLNGAFRAVQNNEAAKVFAKFIKDNFQQTEIIHPRSGKDFTFYGLTDRGTPLFTFEKSPMKHMDALTFYIKGQQYNIRVGDPLIHNVFTEAGVMRPAIDLLAGINNFMRNNLTITSPFFPQRNLLRDLPSAMKMMWINQGFRSALKTMGGGLAVTKDIMKYVNLETKGEYSKIEELALTNNNIRMFHNFTKDGGRFVIDAPSNVESILVDLQRAYKHGDKKKAARAFFRYINVWASTLENVSRMGTYKVIYDKAINNGEGADVARRRAALAAKRIAVDFRQTGIAGRWLNSMWLFSKATLSYGDRVIDSVGKKENLGRLAQASTASFLLSFAAATMNLLYNEDEYSRMSETERDNWLRFPFVNLRVPVPFLSKLEHNLARNMAEQLWGGETIREKSEWDMASESFRTVLTMYSPVDLLQTNSTLLNIIPTAISPIVRAAYNEGYGGTKIYPEQNPFGVQKPAKERYYESATTVGHIGAALLNPLVDISPNAVDYLVTSYTGWYGQLGSQINRMIAGKATHKDIPFINDFMSAENRFKNMQEANEIYQARETKLPVRDINVFGNRLRAYYRDSENKTLDRKKLLQYITVMQDAQYLAYGGKREYIPQDVWNALLKLNDLRKEPVNRKAQDEVGNKKRTR